MSTPKPSSDSTSSGPLTLVTFSEQDLQCRVPEGTSLLDAARAAKAPEGDACGGVCACSTCHLYIDAGEEFLTEASEEEEDILDKAFDVRINSRLGCQAKVTGQGAIVVRISQESLDAYYNEHPDVPRPD